MCFIVVFLGKSDFHLKYTIFGPLLKRTVPPRRLTAGNAVKTLVNLDKFAADDGAVKEKVIGFIKKNAREVVEVEDWKVFVKNYPDLVTDIVKAIVI